jgi:hypothetical protein
MEHWHHQKGSTLRMLDKEPEGARERYRDSLQNKGGGHAERMY